jgi:CheY-like chemotaxis protein
VQPLFLSEEWQAKIPYIKPLRILSAEWVEIHLEDRNLNFENQNTKKQILFASPDSGLLPMLKFLLVADGFWVVVENEIKKAIESIEWRRPDLILFDLPGLANDKAGTFSAIREMQSHPPMVFLVEPQFLCLAAGQMAKNGTCRFITKPIDYQKLRNFLRLTPAPAPDLNKMLIAAESM